MAERFKAAVLFPIYPRVKRLVINRNPAQSGGVAERFKAAVLKTVVPEKVP